MKALLCALFLYSLLCTLNAVYLPGVIPHEYIAGDKVDLYINSLVSPATLKPLDYFHIPVCDNKTKPLPLNLGRRIAGSSVYKSGYQIITGQNTPACKVLCIKNYNSKELGVLSKLVDERYQINWFLPLHFFLDKAKPKFLF